MFAGLPPRTACSQRSGRPARRRRRPSFLQDDCPCARHVVIIAVAAGRSPPVGGPASAETITGDCGGRRRPAGPIRRPAGASQHGRVDTFARNRPVPAAFLFAQTGGKYTPNRPDVHRRTAAGGTASDCRRRFYRGMNAEQSAGPGRAGTLSGPDGRLHFRRCSTDCKQLHTDYIQRDFLTNMTLSIYAAGPPARKVYILQK